MTQTPSPDANLIPSAPVIPVSMLNRLARERLESTFPLCWVAGEVSNLTYASSGHVYFSLKDASAQVRCVMFRNRVQLMGWRLENGQHIEARVLVTLYEARGDFQLNVEAARKAGIGNLYEQFLRLKDKLAEEGLFSPDKKRPLPAFPRAIGIVTSLQAAALRDVLTTLTRRAPQVRIILYPTPVQGEHAAAQISTALRLAGKRAECDLLILCRGGGSLEDLWAFNDEALARAIRTSPLPVITGIGHETDFTIADFAADQRAPTPTAAAELAAPEQSTLLAALLELDSALRRLIRHPLDQRNQRLDELTHRLRHPRQHLAQQHERLLNLQRRLDSGLTRASAHGQQRIAGLTRRLLLARPDTPRHERELATLASEMRHQWQQTLSQNNAILARLSAGLGHLDPEAVLARGYSIVTDKVGRIVRDSQSLEPNDHIAVCFHNGRAEATVRSVTKDA